MRFLGPGPTVAEDAATKQYVDAAVAPRTAQVIVDFGDPAPGGQDETTAYATGFAGWVTATSIITCVPDPAGTPDHGAEDFVLEGVQVAVTYLEPGIGFDLIAAAPAGTWGRYLINCIG